MPGPSLIVFDCDGVLIDSEVIACRTDSMCLAEIGIAMSAQEIMQRYVGISTIPMLADIARLSGKTLPENFADTLHRRVAVAFETDLRPIAGVAAMLAALSHAKCVASSSAPERLRHSLSVTGLLHHFEPHIFSATQVARGKPAPDLFLFAAAQMRSAPADCLVIEDSEPGVRAATAAGMRVLGFTGGGHCGPAHADRLRSAGAALVFDDMSRLTDLI